MKWSRSPFFFLLPARCPTAVCQIVPLKIEGISNLLRVESLLLHLLDVEAKINRAWNLLTTPLKSDLDYHRCGSVVSDSPIRLSNLYAKRFQLFFPTFPQLINEQASLLSAPICQVKGYQAFLYVKLEHIGAVAWFIGEFNSSIRLLMTYSSDGAGRIQR